MKLHRIFALNISTLLLAAISGNCATPDKIAEYSQQLDLFNPEGLQKAINYYSKRYRSKYPGAISLTQELNAAKAKLSSVKGNLKRGSKTAIKDAEKIIDLQRKILLSNPELNFSKIVVVKRKKAKKASGGDAYGLPANWQGNTSINGNVWDNEIATISLKKKNSPYKTVFKPSGTQFVGNVDLHYTGKTMLFSSLAANGRWQIFESSVTDGKPRQITPSTENDVDNYDPCYLPDGKIVYNSTSCFYGVPCVGGADYVANLQILDPKSKKIRRITYDQENGVQPVVMNSGRLAYLRWEYTDSAHYFSRILMHMNPDGSDQRALYGSNSYWPNTMFYPQPIPGKSSQFVAIVSGHHGVRRFGRLVLFDYSKGRREADGVVQEIPYSGKKVTPIYKDGLVNGVWPLFIHPHPISSKNFLVSCKPSSKSPVGIYLVDTFDNMLLIKQDSEYALFEPIPLRKKKRPPVIAKRIDTDKKDATVFIQDIYQGEGLRGVPRGTVKKLRVFQYEYAYRNMGGHYALAIEGPWDVRRLLGTVPVYPDGSAMFKVPANVPLAIQPLDSNGAALQQMRSWLVAMPGENLACIGCHEDQNMTPPMKRSMAASKRPHKIKPWYGPVRGFSFNREVQPVLDKYCVGCHNGSKSNRPNFKTTDSNPYSTFSSPYLNLHPYVRRNGPEGDWTAPLMPGEFHVETSELFQILRKGHHNVKLDKEAWDRLTTWVDLNLPFHGTWTEANGRIPRNYEKRRYDLKKLYSGVDEDIESVPKMKTASTSFIKPPSIKKPKSMPKVSGWPFNQDKANSMQKAAGKTTMNIDLGDGVNITMKRIPSGSFTMGSNSGEDDEYPISAVKIQKQFWMAETEISQKQYRQFKADHKNGWYDMHYKDQVRPGYNMDKPDFPAIRVSWMEARSFCKWLSNKIGKKVSLPTEAQWEWACRAGSSSPMWFGDTQKDFSELANLADRQLKKMAVKGVDPQPIRNPNQFVDFIPKAAEVDDDTMHLAPVSDYNANPWGLKNMHGNVCEWTLDNYRPYPYKSSADTKVKAKTRKTVRGGSWRDRPHRATSSYRLGYPVWQRVYNVGFRIVIED